MPYRMAGIDVHKKRLAIVVADAEAEDHYQFERRWYGSNPEQLRVLSEWLVEQQVEEVVMESTAQYWKPVWETLERSWKAICQSREGAGRMSGTLHLAQALSNRGRRGRKSDFRDAERLVNTANWLLNDPRTRKWMIQCLGCRPWGYQHDAPKKFFGRAHLERYFEPMNLDGRGLCEQCRTSKST